MELSLVKHLYPEAVVEVAEEEVNTMAEVVEVTTGAEVSLSQEVPLSTPPPVSPTTVPSGRTTTGVWA